jgi:phenylalanyl-tRNA synthetase alpha chain
MDGLDTLKSDWLGRIGAASDEAVLEDLRVAALGKKGEISLKMRELGQMSPEERQVAGPALNALKDEVNAAHHRQEGRAGRCSAR